MVSVPIQISIELTESGKPLTIECFGKRTSFVIDEPNEIGDDDQYITFTLKENIITRPVVSSRFQSGVEIVGVIIGQGNQVSVIFSTDLARFSIPMSLGVSVPLKDEDNIIFTHGSFGNGDEINMKISFFMPFEFTGGNQ